MSYHHISFYELYTAARQFGVCIDESTLEPGVHYAEVHVY